MFLKTLFSVFQGVEWPDDENCHVPICSTFLTKTRVVRGLNPTSMSWGCCGTFFFFFWGAISGLFWQGAWRYRMAAVGAFSFEHLIYHFWSATVNAMVIGLSCWSLRNPTWDDLFSCFHVFWGWVYAPSSWLESEDSTLASLDQHPSVASMLRCSSFPILWKFRRVHAGSREISRAQNDRFHGGRSDAQHKLSGPGTYL